MTDKEHITNDVYITDCLDVGCGKFYAARYKANQCNDCPYKQKAQEFLNILNEGNKDIQEE